MAKSYEGLIDDAREVRDERDTGENTALRVGTLFADVVGKIKETDESAQATYATKEEEKTTNSRITELKNGLGDGTIVVKKAECDKNGNEITGSYLSKKKADTAQGLITFEGGVNFGTKGQSGSVDADGNAEFKSLKLRESLVVPELQHNRATVFKGIQYLSFGGGVVESVNTANQTMKLKLESGEALGVDVGDLCVGYWHFADGTNNAGANSDSRNGNFNIAGFCSIYFRVDSIDSDNTIHYSLRSGYSVPPVADLNFACIANNNYSTHKPDRHACKITTTDYEIRLQKLYDWTYTSDNIYRIEGKLDGFSMTAVNDGITYKQDFEGHGVVFGNAYMYGTLQQFDREVWSMVLWHENDNLLSDTPKLLSCQVYRNGIEVDYSNDGTGGTFGNISYKRISEDSDSDDDWNDSHSNKTDISISLKSSDLPDGYDTATFQVTAVCYSMGVDGKGSNVTSVSESVTFHRLKQGTAGRGIVDVKEYYAVSDDNVNAPTSDWKTPSQNEAIPTTTRGKRYLWNYEEIEYDKEDENGDTTKKTTPAVIGTYGDDGRGIESITEWYGVSSDVNTEPTNWFTAPQKTDPTNKYLWNKEDIKYTDGKTETTDPAIIGTHGEKGNDGNDGKDAVQPNYMNGTSVDGTVERNEWRVNTYNNSSNPYRVNDNPQFEDFPHLTLNPSVFGKKCRFSFDIKGSFATVSAGAYYVLQTEFSLPWVKGIVQPTEDLSRLYGYVDLTINGTTYRSGRIDSGYSYTKEVTVSNVSVQLARNSTTTVPTSNAFGSSVNLTTTYKYLFARLAITKSNGSVRYSDGVLIENFTATSSVTVYASNAVVFTNVEGVNNTKPTAGVTLKTSKWLGKKNYSSQSNLVINESANTTFTFPSNTTDFKAYLRIYKMYNSTNSYTTYKNIKVELYDEKRKENTAYIPSENDKARATNVNLLDGTRNGKNSEGKEIWTGKSDGFGTISIGDNLFTFASDKYDSKLGDCLKLKSPTLKLSGNYTLSFDAKMSNCRAARWLTYNDINEKNVYETDWMEMSNDWKTHRILLARYNGDFHFRFDSMLSVAAGTTSNLYIRNIKLEEGCFGTAWTISENDKGGKPGFTYRPCGTYDKDVKYTSNSKVQDVVYYKDDKNPGNTGYYICINQPPRAGIIPTEETYWEKSSYIKFLSVEALFADNLFANAIKGENGYFNGLTAEEVKISGELNATKGTFHDVVINGAYNKLFQVIDESALGNFFYYNEKDGNYYPLLHSWGDAIRINRDLIGSLNVYLPALVPEIFSGKIRVRPWEGYKKTSEGIKSMTMDDVRSLIGRQFVIYLEDADSTMNFKANAIRKRQQYEQNEFNALSSEGSVWEVNGYGSETEAGVGVDGGMVLVLELKVGYRRLIFNSYTYYYEMLYWDAATINTLESLI